MHFFYLLFLFILFIVIYLSKSRETSSKKNRFLDTFVNKNKSINKKRYNAKEAYANQILRSPTVNIHILDTDQEEVLIEKANIHRARLAKFGKSKMNNVLYFKGPRGGVYIYNANGNKKYI